MNIFTVLTVVLAVLKLTGLITIAWWQVFIPTYMAIGLFIIQLFLYLIN